MKETERPRSKTLAFFNSAAAAKYLGVSPTLLRHERHHFKLIEFYQIGSEIWYDHEILDEWKKTNLARELRTFHNRYKKLQKGGPAHRSTQGRQCTESAD